MNPSLGAYVMKGSSVYRLEDKQGSCAKMGYVGYHATPNEIYGEPNYRRESVRVDNSAISNSKRGYREAESLQPHYKPIHPIPASPISQSMGYRVAPPSSPTWTTCSPTWTACSPVQHPPAGYIRQRRPVTSSEPIKLDMYQQQVQNRNMAALPESNPMDTTKEEQFENDFAAYLGLVKQQADAVIHRLAMDTTKDKQQKDKDTSPISPLLETGKTPNSSHIWLPSSQQNFQENLLTSPSSCEMVGRNYVGNLATYSQDHYYCEDDYHTLF